MKAKPLILTVLLFAVSLKLFANPVTDSIGVKNVDGKKVILFKVKAKDTYYSIGHRYNVKPDVIMKFNDSKKALLSIGATIKVPTDQPYKKSGKSKETTEKTAKETKQEKKDRLAKEAKEEAKADKKHKHTEEAESDQQPTSKEPGEQPVVQQPGVAVQQPKETPAPPVRENNSPPMQYKVSAGETLYAISKRFNTTVDDVTKLNNLSSTNLVPGQVLMVRSGAATNAPAQPAIDHSMPVAKRDSTTMAAPVKDSSSMHVNANRFGLYEKNEKGVATWIDDSSLDASKKLVLHRTAPIGTVIKITNPMTNRTTFAKVVGRFTDNESTKDVIIVMTKNVADSLGALDKRIHVNITYGSPSE